MSRISFAMMEAGFIPGDLGAFKAEGGKIRLYDSGPSQQQPTQQSVTQLSYPEEFKPMVTETAGRALAEASRPYTRYMGERIAGFDPFQLTAQQAVANLGPAQQLGPASQFATAAGLKAGDVQYAPQQFGTASFTTPGLASLYMSPYSQNVIDIQQREAQRQADIANQQLKAQAVSRGAYGGSRQAIMEAEAARNLAQQKGDIQQRGQQAAFEQAQNLYGTEAGRALQAQQALEQSRQYGSGLTMQGLQTQLQAAQQLGGLGAEQMKQQQGLINALQGVGQQRQALQQQMLTREYEDFLAQKQYPYQQIAFLTEMLKGMPQQTTEAVYRAPPSLTAQLAGLGTAAYGASKFFAGGGLADLAVDHLMKG
jgi:hypothetical protein